MNTIQCKVIPAPNRFITGILPNNKRIEEEMTLELNEKEIRTCMNNGAMVATLNGAEINLDEKNWFSVIDEQKEPETPEPTPPDNGGTEEPIV